jgi:MFS family permease
LDTIKKHRLAVTVFFFISGFGYASWASRIPTIQQQLKLNEAQLGLTLFAPPVGLLLTMPFTKWLLKNYASRIIMLFGSLFFCVVLSLPGFTGYVWQLVIVLICFGSSRNMLNLSMNAQAVDIQALYKTPIMTTFHGIWSLAGFAGAGTGYFMVKNHIGPGYHLFGVSLLLFLLTILFYRDSLFQAPRPEAPKKLFSLPEKPILIYSIICFGSMACENTMYDWGSIYFRKMVHTTNAAATAAFVVYMVSMTSGRFLGDRLTSRLGQPRLLKYSGMLIFTGMMLAVLLPYPVPAALGYVMVGFGVSCIVPLVFSMAGKNKNINSGSALASISTLGYLGFLLVPPFIGLVAQATSLRWSFAAISLTGLLITLMISRADPH